jgi:hypothetical protein
VETARKTSLLGFGRLGELLSTIDDLLAKLSSLKVEKRVLVDCLFVYLFVCFVFLFVCFFC